MAPVFTDYIRSLDAGREPPDERAFAVLWSALRAALRSEIRRRGLWQSSPSYLGVHGWESWRAAAGGPRERFDPLEELAADCYSFVFIRRLRGLKAQLLLKPDVDGLVQLAIRQFLHERQKEHDPLGFRVFSLLRAAVQRALARGELEVLAGDPRVRNDTLLGFPRTERSPGRPRGDLHEMVAGWTDDLLPHLLTARGQRQDEVTETLRGLLGELRAEGGIARFRFKEVIDPLKHAVRARWAAILLLPGDHAPAGTGGSGALLPPVQELADAESFRNLSARVAAALDGLEVDASTRGYLQRLWRLLCEQARQPRDDERPLSHRRIAALLHIPRERLPELFRTLGDLVTACRQTTPPARGRT